MKRIIFTLYDEMNSDDLVEQLSKIKFDEYFDRLLANKEEYAKSIGVDFKFYKNTFESGYLGVDDDYVAINLYKHKLLRELAEEYDEILYVDFDVVFNTELNFFDEVDLSKGIAVKDQDNEIVSKNIDDHTIMEIPRRSPTLKYHISRDMLDKECHVINTGIMGARAEHIKELQFIERFNDAAKLIQEKTDPWHFIRKEFYTNNEAIFSYIIEKFNVPYQLLPDEWHDIRDHQIKEEPLGHMIHFINKIFDAYYRTKTRVVYSLYIEIPDDKLDDPGNYDWDTMNKSERTKLEFKNNYDKLIENKKEYAKACKADWKLFLYDDDYLEFAKDYPLLSEYDILNLYKIYLLDKLSKEYDYVLYLDFDVIARRNIDFFEVNDVEKHICCQWMDVTNETKLNTNKYNRGYRAPITKYWNSHALLSECDMEDKLPPFAFNTGIVGASSRVMKQLGYFDDIKETIDIMTELKEDEFGMYPPKIREQFGYDNESIFGYKVIQNNVIYDNLKPRWHYRIDAENPLTASGLEEWNPILLHVIDKRFDKAFTAVT